MGFTPLYIITTKILKAIASIKVSRHTIIGLLITALMIVSLQETAKHVSTHHSTAIEKNKLMPTEVAEVIKGGDVDQSPILRELSPRQRQALKLFLSSKRVTSKDIADFFQISARQARHQCQKWVQEGFLQISDAAPKTRSYKLVEKYEALVRTRIAQTPF